MSGDKPTSVETSEVAVIDTKEDVYTYEAPWLIYSMDWSVRPDHPFRLGVCSFLLDCENHTQVIQLNEDGQFNVISEFPHPYPPTNMKWIPDKTGSRPDLMATSSDSLRIWQMGEDSKVSLKSLLSNDKNQYCAPLTSFDWNEANPELIGVSSIDTTCTIWDINKEQKVSQLIAHEKEVYDIAFSSHGSDCFASVGADGSLRMFDLRTLEHSTVLYETQGGKPLLRLSWNRQDPNYLATFQIYHTKIVILDIRYPTIPATELSGHKSCINSLAWAPHSTCHICTSGDDKQALIWHLSSLPKEITDPMLAYSVEDSVNTLQWSMIHPDWISIAYGKRLQILRV